MTFQPNNSLGNYLPEQIWLSQESNKFQSEIKQIFEDHARMINRKDTGSYDLREQLINQQYFGASPQEKRYVYRRVYSFGAIGPGGVLPIAHGITGVTTYTRIYGTIQTAADSRPLPYVDAAVVTNQTSVLVNAGNIIITNGATAPAIVSGIVVLEYLKN